MLYILTVNIRYLRAGGCQLTSKRHVGPEPVYSTGRCPKIRSHIIRQCMGIIDTRSAILIPYCPYPT